MIPEDGVLEIKPKADTGKRFRSMVVYTWDCPYCGDAAIAVTALGNWLIFKGFDDA